MSTSEAKYTTSSISDSPGDYGAGAAAAAAADVDTLVMPLPMDSAADLQEFASATPISLDGDEPATVVPPVTEPAAKEPPTKGWFFKKRDRTKDCTFRWSPTSPTLLEQAETGILSYVNTPYRGQYVDLATTGETKSAGSCRWGKQKKQERKMWTVVFNPDSPNPPLVMVHGLCAALGLWAMNIDDLAKDRPVYTIDLLGFGRSSRPSFGKDAVDAELNHVQALEDWRRAMQLERFTLLGHSMGGFISTGYALRYPQHVSHLVLADPWGFPKKPDNALEDMIAQSGRPRTVKLVTTIGQRVNALGIVRAAGPLGPGLIDKVRPDLVRKFEPLSNGAAAAAEGNGGHGATVGQYIYHCNAQKPTGEEAFRKMMDWPPGWAKNCMVNRIKDLDPTVPMSLIYGGSSWLRHAPEEQLVAARPPGAQTKVYILPEAGHHVYVDSMRLFNRIVNSICGGGGDGAKA